MNYIQDVLMSTSGSPVQECARLDTSGSRGRD